MDATTWPRARELRAVAALFCAPTPPAFPQATLRAAPGAAALAALGRVPASAVRQVLESFAAWRATAQDTSLVTYWDAAYPPLLREIARPPLALFACGDVRVLALRAVAMVGARAAAAEARHWTHGTAGDLARCGVVVASGLARGIDAAAHQGALDAGGPTVAVLGCGPDECYPPEHAGLSVRIARTGCLLSEFPPGTLPLAWHFPRRNRILAGLCAGVVVVQAVPKSGALVTARYALEENRQVMAVPGPVDDARSQGPHALLRDGAALVASAADVLEVLRWHPVLAMAPREAAAVAAAPPDETSAHLLAALGPGRAVEDLRAALGWDAARLQSALAALELAGWIVRQPGGRIARAGPGC